MKARYIPNILSVIRIMLVGVFVYVFFRNYPSGIIPAFIIFALSGITDVVDGALARHFGWISKVGIVLDPIADKLMQCTVLLCTSLKELTPWWIFAFYILKEGMMGAGALLIFKRRHEVYGSKFFGKFSTVLFYTVIAVILLWGDKIGTAAVNILCIITSAFAVTALVLYSISYLNNKKQELPEDKNAGGIQD